MRSWPSPKASHDDAALQRLQAWFDTEQGGSQRSKSSLSAKPMARGTAAPEVGLRALTCGKRNTCCTLRKRPQDDRLFRSSSSQQIAFLRDVNAYFRSGFHGSREPTNIGGKTRHGYHRQHHPAVQGDRVPGG